MSKLERYLTRGMHSLPGYFERADALVWLTLFRAQAEAGTTGALAEIGIYFGRSFLALCNARREDEVAWGCDTFEMLGEGKQRRIFNDNLAREITDVRIDIYACRSDALDIKALRAAHGPCRFVHIDGSHKGSDVLGDAGRAAAVLGPKGIMVFDDFLDPAWPDVTLALAKFLEDPASDFRIFALTRKKVYIAQAQAADAYMNAVIHAGELHKLRIEKVAAQDRKVPLVKDGFAAIGVQRVIDMTLKRIKGI